MLTWLIWALKNPGKEGRKSLVEEGNSVKPMQKILADKIISDDWSSGHTHRSFGSKPQEGKEHE